MKKIADYKHKFVGRKTNVEGVCRVRVFLDEATSKYVAVCTHLAENRYKACSYQSLVPILKQVKQDTLAAANDDDIVWIDHSPFDVGPEYGKHRLGVVKNLDQPCPDWRHVGTTDLKSLTGLEFKELA
uniref:hypothetical protein n=1 Tax=Thaumasiovibrio occultus TaxID=1891184 RepID=UPI000B35E60E|nr:hypothetical protein [Thaumasiovibrio occultus]